MIPESISQSLILIHAGLGGMALIAGGVALIVKKGARWHKLSGKMFFWSMLVSALLSLVIAVSPGHVSTFLFAIGVFSIYFLISGYSALAYRKSDYTFVRDKVLAGMILLVGLAMILMSYRAGAINLVLLIFGIVGSVFGIMDFMLLRDQEKLKSLSLSMHLRKMTGGYLAAISAFFVVNNILPGMWNWFGPSIIGTLYIVYWTRKISRK